MLLKFSVSTCIRSCFAALSLLALQTTPAASQATATPDAAAAPSAQVDTAAKAAPTGFFGSFELGGLADGYYDYYSTKPDGDATFRNFDTRHNAVRFSMAQIWLTKAPTDDSRAGMNLKFNFGHAATLINSYEPSSARVLENIEQAYGSYLIPAGKGLQVDAGKFVTQHGAEVIEAKDNWNYSRSLLFALAIPYYHTGVRATYNVNDKVTLMGDVVTGWNNVKDNNGGKTVGAQLILKPVSQVTIIQNYMTGAEQAHDSTDRRHLLDSTVTVTATKMVSLMANYDYGKDSIAGAPVSWQGIAGYAKFQATPWFAIIPRAEWFDDPDGFTTGSSQTLKEGTLTGEFKLANGLLSRIEYRRDVSNVASFATSTGQSTSQGSFAIGVLYSISSKH
jgi:hypothetical protein